MGLHNLRIVQHDAVEVLRDMIAPASLAGVHIFFPDPWPKKRHHKRRLLQPPFVALLASRLQPDGYIHCATDWEDYAQQMLAVLCGREPGWRTRRRLRAAPRLSPADQVRAAWPAARARGLGSGLSPAARSHSSRKTTGRISSRECAQLTLPIA
jgi:tRNA G46 methylase TrmB